MRTKLYYILGIDQKYIHRQFDCHHFFQVVSNSLAGKSKEIFDSEYLGQANEKICGVNLGGKKMNLKVFHKTESCPYEQILTPSFKFSFLYHHLALHAS